MANSDRSMVTIEELRRVLSSLETQKDIIHDTYYNKIKAALESSKDCFRISGLDFATIEQTYDNNFRKIDLEMQKLIAQLNTAISKYSELTVVIKQLFNKDFASQLSQLLDLK